ncbi:MULTISPECIES: hypothetical protein [unclassified Mycobacterium]|uniref:hypothetical protein n=1 Tax=unclassified Mycobacterium TaxID=2642494 RepID=UPI0029C99A55|nr:MULTISPECIES: hypothetical protein [unclassified Mycobacterium]
MAMTDHDRKKLWGQAAATCSICRKALVQPAEHPDDRDALLGEEAHIISASRSGPRGSASVPGMRFDGYYNRILLCRIHHRIVDEQPRKYTVEKLRAIRSHHEQWVRDRLHVMPDESASTPVGVRLKHPGFGMVLPRLRTGKDAWHSVIGSSFYLLDPVDEDDASIDACNVADKFLTNLKDYGEFHDAITDRGFESIREAQRDLREGLDELSSHGLATFGAQRDMLITGGSASPTPCTMAVAVIRPLTEVGDEHELPIVFPASLRPSTG